MGEGEAARRYHAALHAAVAGLLAFVIAVTIWGLATPVFTVWGTVTNGVAFVWIDANESRVDALVVLATAPLATLAWTVLIGRRLPWPIGPRRPWLAIRAVLLVIPGIAGLVLALTVTYVPAREVWVAPGASVVFGQVPAIQAAMAVVLAAGVGLAVIVSVPVMAAVLRRLDPTRAVIWLAGPATDPAFGDAEPEPA